MSERHDKLYITVMIEAANAIERFVENLKREDFQVDELRQSAVIQKLSVIGTAAVRLPREFWKRHSDINWRGIAKFRFIGLHEYFSNVDSSLLWVTAKRDVPALRDKLHKILESQERL